MKEFAKVTKLSNIGGRADYITDPNRQEKIVCKSAEIDWKPYSEFEKNNPKTGKIIDGIYTPTPNNEGREIMIPLPNNWAVLPPEELAERAKTITEFAVEKNTDLQWAVHHNTAKYNLLGKETKPENLHLHAVFSERTVDGAAGTWDRDIYLQENGKVARSRATRAKDADGNEKPPKHCKGEPKGGFTEKTTKYKTKSWNTEIGGRVAAYLKDNYGVEVSRSEPWELKQYHVGKKSDGSPARPNFAAKNEYYKKVNAALREAADGGIGYKELMKARSMILDISSRADVGLGNALPELKKGVLGISYREGRGLFAKTKFEPVVLPKITHPNMKEILKNKAFILENYKLLGKTDKEFQKYSKSFEKRVELGEDLQLRTFKIVDGEWKIVPTKINDTAKLQEKFTILINEQKAVQETAKLAEEKEKQERLAKLEKEIEEYKPSAAVLDYMERTDPKNIEKQKRAADRAERERNAWQNPFKNVPNRDYDAPNKKISNDERS